MQQLLLLGMTLLIGTLALSQNQRVFVNTSSPTVSLPDTNQQVILASQPVGLSLRQLWSFDLAAEGVIGGTGGSGHGGNGFLGVWICDKPDCTGTVKAHIGDISTIVQVVTLNSNYVHVTGTFAQTNHSHPDSAVLVGELYFLHTFGPEVECFGCIPTDIATPATAPIDLYSGNRSIVLTLTCTISCLVTPQDTIRITVFRVNLLP